MTLWTVALQAPLFMGFSRQEHWSGLPFPSPGNHSHPGFKLASLKCPALPGGFFTTSTTWEALSKVYSYGKIANLIIVQAEILNRGRMVYIPWDVF